MTSYRIIGAWAQCGTEPPFNCLPLPHRMNGDRPEIKIMGAWLPFPKDGPRPALKTYFGMPVAGIASDWETA